MIDSESVWRIIEGIASAGVGGFFGFIFSKKKYDTEVKNNEINNFDSSINAFTKMYDKMVEDLKGENESLKNQITELKKEIETDREQIMALASFIVAISTGDSTSSDDLLKIQQILENTKKTSHID